MAEGQSADHETAGNRHGTTEVLRILGKGLGLADLIDAHLLDADARQRQIESEPLPPTIYDVVADAAADVPDQIAWHFFSRKTRVEELRLTL